MFILYLNVYETGMSSCPHPGTECLTPASSDGSFMTLSLWIFVVFILLCFTSDYFVLQTFVDNFHAAKEALSVATAQAAEKAASSVRDFAQKSFRLSMDVKLKAPLIIIPESSTSYNALVVDLGLITVGNSFSLLLAEGFSLPAVVEKMEVKLTQLKLSRYESQPGTVHCNKAQSANAGYKHVQLLMN